MNYSKGDIILLPYPFTDLSIRKVRPAIVVGSDKGKYEDIFVVPLTSKVNDLSDGEFILESWQASGLNVPSAVKRGCILIDTGMIISKVGVLSGKDLEGVNHSLNIWLEL